MPKASSTALTAAQAANLGRHQACHRCRRKKLKCDAKMPCGACVRSHSFAIKQNGTSAFLTMECVYDDPDDIVDNLKSRVMKLENRIEELEELLRKKEAKMARCTCGSGSRAASEGEGASRGTMPHSASGTTELRSLPSQFTSPDPNETDLFTPVMPMGSDAPPISFTNLCPNESPTEVGRSTAFMASGPRSIPPITDFDPINFKQGNFLWPINLPPPDVLQHLVEIFFSSVPLATRLIHKPTFMTSLQEAPTSVLFPQVSLLHAICALASVYTRVDKDIDPLDTCIGSQHLRFFHSGVVPPRPDHEKYEQGIQYTPMQLEDIVLCPKLTFGAMHIRWAANAFKFATFFADRLVQVLQAAIVCTWYNYSMGLQLNLYGWLGIVGRSMLPLGFNVSPGYEPLSRLQPSVTMLLPGPYKYPMKEIPRNLYWIAFSMERIYSAPTVWPVVISDDDSSQTMPVCLHDFLTLKEVPNDDRQHIHTPGYFTNHPAGSTDSFSLYIKGTVLLSKVKTFNGRFRIRNNVGGVNIDPRETTEFQILDNKILSFMDSFPKEFKDPVSFEDAQLDPILYMAHLLPHIATILLHDPHAKIRSPNCLSAKKLLSAARSILEMIYKVCATSYDLIYLDHACSTCWLIAGVVLVRFKKAAMVLGNVEEMEKLKEEIDGVRFIMGNLSKRTVIGIRQKTMLDEFYAAEMGERPLPPKEYTTEAFVEDIVLPD